MENLHSFEQQARAAEGRREAPKRLSRRLARGLDLLRLRVHVGPAIDGGLMSAADFDRGIADLYRTAESDGVFCYTFFKASAIFCCGKGALLPSSLHG